MNTLLNTQAYLVLNQLLFLATDPFTKETTTEEKTVAFYSPQAKTFVTSQDHYVVWLKRMSKLRSDYLYCIKENGS